MAKKKEEKQVLTQELMDRLSADGYCFDLEHSGDIARLNDEKNKLSEELKKSVPIAELEKIKAATQQEIKEKKDRIYDLEDELKKAKDESETYESMWRDGETKLASTRPEMENELRKNAACFNPFHNQRLLSDQVYLTIPEFAVFGRILTTELSSSSLEARERIAVTLPKSLHKYLDTAIDSLKALVELARIANIKGPSNKENKK